MLFKPFRRATQNPRNLPSFKTIVFIPKWPSNNTISRFHTRYVCP